MTHSASFSRLAVFALLAFAFSTAVAQAVITKLTPLAEVLESEQFIFTAKVEKLDPDNKDRPSATFKLDKKLKGEAPFDRIPVNMVGDDEARKAGDTKTVFDRLDTKRELVFFVRKQGKLYNAKVFVEGSWFSLYGVIDGDKVKWAFLHGEPYLRRTFKGTTAEMVKTIEDALAKKAKPPEPDDKEKPGYGPAVEKSKEEKSKEEKKPNNDSLCASSNSPALFAVLPSFVIIGPLAVIAALFPSVAAPMAVALRRWRAFLVVASINSTLALIYWAIATYSPQWLPAGQWFGPQMMTVYMTAVALIGLVFAGRRYRRMAAEEPNVTDTPGRRELYVLAGLTVLLATVTVVSAFVTNWQSVIEIPLREFTFIGIAFLTATLYALYRIVTKSADAPSTGDKPPMRLSISGESIAIGVLVLCGFVSVLQMNAPSTQPIAENGPQKAGAVTVIGPRLLGDPVAIVAREEGQNEPEFGNVMSNLTLDGDQLYFGTDISRNGGVMCMNRHTGKVVWHFTADGDPPKFLPPVYCTPTIAGGKVYCGEGMHENTSCRFFCMNAADGTPAWKKPFETTSHTEGAGVVAGGKVYFPAGDDGLYCVDANSGEKLWHFPGGKENGIHIDAPAAVANGAVFVGSGLYTYVAVALDANTGKEKWRADLGLRAFGTPLASGSQVFYGIGTGNLAADVWHYPEEGDEEKEKTAAGAVVSLDAASGKEVWRYPLPKSGANGLAADAFSVYSTCRDGSVHAIDRKTGKLRWQISIGSSILCAPAVAETGGLPVAVYAVSREGRVFCLNPHTGDVVWSWTEKPLPGFHWHGPTSDVMCTPLVVTTPTATGSKRTIYIGGMQVQANNINRRAIAVFKFEDVLGE